MSNFNHQNNHQNPSFYGNELNGENSLLQYVKSMHPETISQLSQPVSPDTLQLIIITVANKLNQLTPQQFNGLISTNRDSLGKLLGEAMVDGYFLRNAEQRMEFEKTLQLTTNKQKQN
ncbi:MAG: DUF760 domain-containing protein [Nostocaceae cyanobacterium]|nr:DUF760 domain-containing protein [Nostocaceae cyanobacterium]